jgi:hypothetical protein
MTTWINANFYWTYLLISTLNVIIALLGFAKHFKSLPS